MPRRMRDCVEALNRPRLYQIDGQLIWTDNYHKTLPECAQVAAVGT